MKKILVFLMVGALILISGCSGAAEALPAPSDSVSGQPQPEQLSPDDMRQDRGSPQARPSDFPREDNKNEVLGKITAISENTITLAIGTINRPEGRGTPRAKDGSRPESAQSRQERPRGDGSRPESAPSMPERRAGGGNGGPGGGFPGGFMDLEYSGEEASYTLSDTAAITKGMGEESKDLTISDLKEDDVVRLLLDESGQPVSLQVFELSVSES